MSSPATCSAGAAIWSIFAVTPTIDRHRPGLPTDGPEVQAGKRTRWATFVPGTCSSRRTSRTPGASTRRPLPPSRAGRWSPRPADTSYESHIDDATWAAGRDEVGSRLGRLCAEVGVQADLPEAEGLVVSADLAL